ncbi:hypothetical protein PRZ48_014970 [Zasmidium cellare]|uniref:Uncharacterized protein n=1 Tax=Zasmidium cellare TaxID=395010 RepID=A0ABR0DXA2_ZASCE|nr:hypothetical protein PRZ48_014970 [Zasmidium cellare]
MSLDQLMNRLDCRNTDTRQNPYHILHYQFPAPELLPPGAKLHLEPPRFVAQRNRPPISDPLALGMLDTAFYTMIPTASDPTIVRGQGKSQELLTAVEALSHFPGTSLLKISAHLNDTNGQQNIGYRFRLESETNNGFKVTKDFELDSIEMGRLREAPPEHRWVGLIDHLINRETDRAYMHVRSNMDIHHPGVSLDQMHAMGFGVDKKLDVVEVFKNSLVQLKSDTNNRQIELGTRCGHSLTIDRVAFENIADEDCFSATCPQCKTSIIDDDTLAKVKVSQASEEVAVFRKNTYLWTRLDHEIPPGEFNFKAEELWPALEMSYQSLSPPALACLPVFSFGFYPATKAILKTFRSKWQDSLVDSDMFARELADSLFGIAMDTKMGSSEEPLWDAVYRPHFERDLRFWLRRAVNLSIASSRWRVEGPAEEDSLIEAMEGLNLQGASVASIGAMFEKLGL